MAVLQRQPKKENSGNQTHEGHKRTKTGKKRFGQYLFTYTFNELVAGNNAKRVVQSIEIIRKDYPDAIDGSKMLPIAPALFRSNHPSLIELALWGAKKAKKEDVFDWLVALDHEADELDMKLYEGMATDFAALFKSKRMYRHDLEKFIYNPSFFVCDFGWRLTPKLYRYELYNLWYNLTHYTHKRRMKEAYLYNAITSDAGATAFINYYSSYSYSINSIPENAVRYILEKGNKKITKFLIKRIKDNLKEQPLGSLHRLVAFPDDLREEIFEDVLKKTQRQNGFLPITGR